LKVEYLLDARLRRDRTQKESVLIAGKASPWLDGLHDMPEENTSIGSTSAATGRELMVAQQDCGRI
jgi:hypothetical protein